MFSLVSPTNTTTYSSNYYIDMQTKYLSLDKISSNQFIATSDKGWYMQKPNLGGTVGSCLFQGTQTIYPIQSSLLLSIQIVQADYPKIASGVNRGATTTIINLNANCQN